MLYLIPIDRKTKARKKKNSSVAEKATLKHIKGGFGKTIEIDLIAEDFSASSSLSNIQWVQLLFKALAKIIARYGNQSSEIMLYMNVNNVKIFGHQSLSSIMFILREFFDFASCASKILYGFSNSVVLIVIYRI